MYVYRDRVDAGRRLGESLADLSLPNPVVLGLPVAEEYADYLGDVLEQLRRKGVRVELDASDDRFPKKIRNASKSKVPYVLIAGEEDRAAGAVSFRFRDGSQKNGVPVDDAIAEILQAIESRAQV